MVTNRLRNRGRHFCTIAELDEAVREFRSSYDVKELPATMESTENAVVYWASVGEVVLYLSFLLVSIIILLYFSLL